jgi:hypothetical protein
MTTVIKRPDDISFDQVVEYISQAKVSGDFRRDILENRLERIGAKDVLENGIIATRGFPFKYHSPLDEAILILHYFLTKSNAIPGAFVRINSIHVPNKEEENTLSFWKSPKAGLYLDLQNLVENNNIAETMPT